MNNAGKGERKAFFRICGVRQHGLSDFLSGR